MIVNSQVTFFYYDDYAGAAKFYEEVMNFPLVQDQGWAKIYRAGRTFFGIVDGKAGSLKPREDNAVMLTLLVDNVMEWHEHLVAHGVKVRSMPDKEGFAEAALYYDPGGYIIEIQHFNNPLEHAVFE